MNTVVGQSNVVIGNSTEQETVNTTANSDDELRWRKPAERMTGSRVPNVGRPIPNATQIQQFGQVPNPDTVQQSSEQILPRSANQIPIRAAGFQQSNLREPVNTGFPQNNVRLIPTHPIRPNAQLIPNAVPPVPVMPAGNYAQLPQSITAPLPEQAANNPTNTVAPAESNFANEPQLFPTVERPIQDPFVQPVSAEEPALADSPQQQEPDFAAGSPAKDSGITRVKKGIESLPNEAGQVWREYDITPYTFNVAGSDRPQQAIIDWILKETGQELWFNEPLGILNANKESLRVYHTPAVQQQVKNIVDRFVFGKGRKEVMGMRLVTINNPSWRTIAYNRMQPIPVQAAGVEGWLISKENAAILINELSRRNDFKQHSGGDLVMQDGQKYNLSSKRPIQFNQSIRWVNSNGVTYAEPSTTQFNEGFSLDFSSLSSIDKRSCEAIIKCEIDQIERLKKVNVTVPTSTGQTQPIDLQIPQMVSWKVHERFRWPSDKVLLLSCGVVATPGPQANNVFDFNSLLNGSRRRADALLFIEYKGPEQPANSTATIPVVGR